MNPLHEVSAGHPVLRLDVGKARVVDRVSLTSLRDEELAVVIVVTVLEAREAFDVGLGDADVGIAVDWVLGSASTICCTTETTSNDEMTDLQAGNDCTQLVFL
jgi:hypothetical protein